MFTASSIAPTLDERLLRTLLRWFAVLCLVVTLNPVLSAVRVQGEEGPQRVISTDAAITEIVVALGAAHRLVGVDDISALPEEQGDLPRLGYHRALSAEGLLSLRPDQLLVSEHAGPARALDPLSSASVPVLKLRSARDVSGLKANVRAIATALALELEGDELTQTIDKRAMRIQDSSVTTGPRAVVVRESNGELRIAGVDSAGHALLTLLGAENAVDYSGYRAFTDEGLIALNPQILILADNGRDSARKNVHTNAGVGATHAEADLLDRHPLLRYSRAAKAKAVLRVDSRALVGGLSLSALSEAERLLAVLSLGEQVTSR